MFRKSATNNESGVALLFALGILSLLLILGLAFASNALLAQKVAANNSNRSQAKLLAQSAISRIAIAVMYYQSQATTHSPVVIPIDYSDVYSYGRDRDNRVFADGLFSTNDSLLTPPSSVTTDTPTSTTYERPKWAFVFDKPESDSDRKIIGRIAYQQVKGSSGMSKISLNNVLRGVYAQESHSTGTPVTNQIPWTNRWGKSIDELNLNNTTPLNNWEVQKPDESSLDVSSLPSFFGAYQDPGEYFYDYTTVKAQQVPYERVCDEIVSECHLAHRLLIQEKGIIHERAVKHDVTVRGDIEVCLIRIYVLRSAGGKAIGGVPKHRRREDPHGKKALEIGIAVYLVLHTVDVIDEYLLTILPLWDE